MLTTYDDSGSGPAVVLLHAGVADRRMWRPQVEALSGHYRVVTPDMRGYGETPLPPETFDYGSDVVALLDHLDIGRAVLVGASFGGGVAIGVAARHPERVAGLALFSAAFGGLEPTPSVKQFGRAEDALLERGDIDGAVRLNVDTWLGPDASEEAKALVAEMQRRAFEVQIAAESGEGEPEVDDPVVDPADITVGTLVVTGAHDMDWFLAIGEHLVATIPNARLVTLPWAGHVPSLERPEAVNDLLSEFLRSLDL